MDAWIIRRARPTCEDAHRLLAVEAASLGDSDYTSEEALALLRRPEQRAYLALDGDEAVGFCSCFHTATSVGMRLEIDLLGVRPSHRGQGLGAALICAAQRDATAEGVTTWRAVVAVDNAASRRAFARAGMEPVGPLHALRVYPLHGFSPVEFLPINWRAHVLPCGVIDAPDGQRFEAHCDGRTLHRLSADDGRTVALAGCIQVHTLSYRGLWIEQVWHADERALGLLARSLVEYAKRQRLDEVGYLHPSSERDPASSVWQAEGLSSTGEYHVMRGHAS